MRRQEGLNPQTLRSHPEISASRFKGTLGNQLPNYTPPAVGHDVITFLHSHATPPPPSDVK